jgi:dihydroorotase (multifunctional complex type)
MLDLGILNGTIISDGKSFRGDVGIEDGRIALVAQPGALPTAKQTLNVEGQLILPGAIDAHFHCRAPAHPQRGDFATETRAAAAGGVTTVLEMPISKPGCSTPEVFRTRRVLGEANVYVNFGLFAAPGTLKREDVLGMAEEGAIAFKIFMHAAPVGREDEFFGLCLPTDDALFAALSLVKETGRCCTIHSESNDLINLFQNQFSASGRNDASVHGESRPSIIEAVAVGRVSVMCRELNVPVNIAHISCRAALDVVRQAQAAGAPLTSEVCTHHLLFDDSVMPKAGPYAKINPPIRPQADVEAMRAGLHDGSINLVVTDHSPFKPEEKEIGWDNIWRAPSGCPGVEMLVPVMLDAALGGRFSLEKAVDLITAAPARLFGMYPRKGLIAPGADADLCLYDPRPDVVVDSQTWFTRAKDCDRLYNGLSLKGQVAHTIVNGKIVYSGGQILGQPGDGRFVRPISLS